MAAEVSYDDGKTWQKLPVKAGDSGEFTALVDNSVASDGFVSLRVHAGAADGSEVVQTVIRAYAVR